MTRGTGLALLALVAASTAPFWLDEGYALNVVNLALLNAIVVVGLNYVSGWAGQINFGQAAFYGLGAYASALVTRAGLPWSVGCLAAILLGAIASLGLGLPTLRLRSYYLAMATIGFGEIARQVFLHWEPVTGGSSGLRDLPPIGFAGFVAATATSQFYVILAFLVVGIILAVAVRRAHFGRAIVATRDSEIAAELAGVDTVRIKIAAFVIAAIYAAVAGSLYAGTFRYISPDSFTNRQAVLFMTMLIVGGAGSIAGAVVGAIALSVLPELLRFMGDWYLVVTGIGVICVIILLPGGMASAFGLLRQRLKLRTA
jgi:branched-chain amino acid transport system permease protein